MKQNHISIIKAARASVVASVLLGSIPAIADEYSLADPLTPHAPQGDVSCHSIVTNSLWAREFRWDCWEHGFGYARSAISYMRIEEQEPTGLHNAYQALHERLEAVLAKG